MTRPEGSLAHLIGLTLANVGLQTVSAILVKAATIPTKLGTASAALLTLVLLLNFGRFVVWNQLHKRYDLSVAYPASALFFPCIVATSFFFGEPVGPRKIAGTVLVTIGVVLLMLKARREIGDQ